MKRSIIYVVLPLVAISLNATSFDCEKAHSVTERKLCSNNYLSRTDEKMASLYRVLRASYPDQRTWLVKSQRIWLKDRERKCGRRKGNALNQCLVQHYGHRIAQLEAFDKKYKKSFDLPDSEANLKSYIDYTIKDKASPKSYVLFQEDQQRWERTLSVCDDMLHRQKCIQDKYSERQRELEKFKKREYIVQNQNSLLIKKRSIVGYLEKTCSDSIVYFDVSARKKMLNHPLPHSQIIIDTINATPQNCQNAPRESASHDEDIYAINDNVVTLEISEYFYSGGAHGYGTSNLINYDRSNGSTIRWKDLFPNSKDIDRYIQQRVKREITGNNSIYNKYIDEFKTVKNFAIIPKGLLIRYQTDEIASHGEGKPKIFIPFSVLRKYMSLQRLIYYFKNDSGVHRDLFCSK